MERLAVKVHNCLEVKDFSRVDFRMDEKNRPYVLEINPLPSLSGLDHFGLIAEKKGWSYEKLIGMIIDAAKTRLKI
jgi:D-alanine-D-alanine ligase